MKHYIRLKSNLLCFMHLIQYSLSISALVALSSTKGFMRIFFLSFPSYALINSFNSYFLFEMHFCLDALDRQGHH